MVVGGRCDGTYVENSPQPYPERVHESSWFGHKLMLSPLLITYYRSWFPDETRGSKDGKDR